MLRHQEYSRCVLLFSREINHNAIELKGLYSSILVIVAIGSLFRINSSACAVKMTYLIDFIKEVCKLKI